MSTYQHDYYKRLTPEKIEQKRESTKLWRRLREDKVRKRIRANATYRANVLNVPLYDILVKMKVCESVFTRTELFRRYNE